MGFNALGWALVSCLRLSTSIVVHHLSFLSQLPYVLSGLVLGGVLSAFWSRRQLRFLSEKRESRMSLATLLYIIGFFLIFGGVGFFLFQILPLEMELSILNFMFPILPSLSAVDTVLFFNWEHKHQQHTMASSGWVGGLYVTAINHEAKREQK
jgi:uncharacterized membrane protein